MRKDNVAQIKKIAVLLIAVGVVISSVYLCWLFTGHSAASDDKSFQTNVISPVYKFFSRLDGLPVDSAEAVGARVVGVMIDNHPNAKPVSGLLEAKVVYEAPVEGGLTRLLAIFAVDQDVSKVGPVRSARPYFLDWLSEYGDALYMHCGGSPAAKEMIQQRDIFDADEFSRGQYYTRDKVRSAPHNLYTSAEHWRRFLDARGAGRAPAPEWQGWKFGEKLNGGEAVREMTIKYGPGYEVTWQYLPAEGVYERVVNGAVQADSSGAAVRAANVMAQFVYEEVLDEIGRKEITAIGRRASRVLRDGVMYRGYWQKNSATERTRFYLEDGKEIVLKPGATWVEIIPEGIEVSIQN